jgi:DNA methyltransferase 1-associated protein 1
MKFYREMTPFTNPARDDGLVLRHWSKRKETNHPIFPATPAESNGALEVEQDIKVTKIEPNYHFAKFNVKLEKPEYTLAQYETHLKSVDWDKPETDYLIELVHEWDLRWVVIADRYDYRPGGSKSQDNSNVTQHTQPKERSMEDMKARYYQVAAKIMALHRPLSQMSVGEFDMHQKMTKFDPLTETKRKKIAEGLLSRTAEEIQEEELLLGELKRIIGFQERFSYERRDLFDRLVHPVSTSGSSAPLSSDELNVLWKNLSNADKSRKSRALTESLANASTSASSQPPVSQAERNPRNSISGPAEKRQSVSGTPTYRQLSPREEAKYGVSHHDRVVGGVQFRHEKVAKLSQAKSNAQATKISAALVELSIPPRLFMPTAKVVSQYERLINSIQALTECRKVTDKAESEIKVLQAQLDEVERRKREGSKPNGPSLVSDPDVKQVEEKVAEVKEEKGRENGAETSPKAENEGDEPGNETETRPKIDDEGEEQERNFRNAVAENEEENKNEDESEEADDENDEEGDAEAAEKSDDASDEDNENDEDDDGGSGVDDDDNPKTNDDDDDDEDEENDHPTSTEINSSSR